MKHGNSRSNAIREVRREELRKYLAERGRLDYVFDNIEKIEALDTSQEVFKNELDKLRVANEQRLKLINKYLPDLKAQEMEHSLGESLIQAIERRVIDPTN